MLFEYISMLLGVVKIVLYKILYFKRISYQNIPKMNHNFKIAIKKGSKLVIGKCLRTRNNVSFRIYDEGCVTIGNHCFFNDGCSINSQKSITIGDNVIVGQNVMIFDHDHDYKNDINKFVKKDVTIGNNVWIGANVTILKGITIGDNVVIGAGTTIKDDIEENTLIHQQIIIANKKIEKN